LLRRRHCEAEREEDYSCVRVRKDGVKSGVVVKKADMKLNSR
jgi:hypothetical protein